MRVKSGRASSSVRPSRRRRTAQQGVAESAVYVNKNQSAAFKYILENASERDRVRHLGDIGSADEHLFVVRSERTLRMRQAQGRQPVSALLRPDPLDLAVDDLIHEAAGDYRLVIRMRLKRRDVSAGYVRRGPGDAR